MQLRDAILESAGADPWEDPTRTAQDMNNVNGKVDPEDTVQKKVMEAQKRKQPTQLPIFAPFDESRFGKIEDEEYDEHGRLVGVFR